MTVLLGAIADDYTGATDLANTLVKAGMPTIQTFGVPAGDFNPGDAAAVVVALKSRSIQVGEAIEESIESLKWLESIGAKQFFFKYCSTFDSTDEGNIGSVADALLDHLGEEFSIVCPAFPTNSRTVYKGHLFVGDILLSESSMKDHPLTPMTDANLVKVMGRQTGHRVGLVELNEVKNGVEAVDRKFKQLRAGGTRYAVVDAIVDDDLLVIGEAARGLKLITGGSGVALGLPENFRRSKELGVEEGYLNWHSEGYAAVLSGSCSAMTRVQVEHAKAVWPSYCLDPMLLSSGRATELANVFAWVDQQDFSTPLIIYSSADPEDVTVIQEKLGRAAAGILVEQAMGDIAKELVRRGVGRLVVAGGETSGAVVKSLGIEGVQVGKEIDPGVPWCRTIGETSLSLALKSGNFGRDDFFTRSFTLLKD